MGELTMVKEYKWASSWDYETYHIDDQRRLRQACASVQSSQSLRCLHTWRMEVDKRADQNSGIYPHQKVAHARLKNEFTEHEKYHNLMSWLKWSMVLMEYKNDTVQSSLLYKLWYNTYLCLSTYR